LSSTPYRTLRFHTKAIRSVIFHKKYPLFATCSDDSTIRVFHYEVFDDWLKDPLIVPLKILNKHVKTSSLGVLNITFHPTQPWLFSSGADQTIRLFTS
jgi:ribosome biogenesis protein ERB1